mgnify:FL=1
MVRSELLKKLCNQHPYLLRKDIKKILDVIFSEISNALARGENIEIRGFGSYKVIKRKARTGINPKNLKTVQVPEKKTIKWKMSKIFFNRLNKNFTTDKISDTH